MSEATTVVEYTVEAIPTAERTRRRFHIPAEGENGLYSQSWFPICLSSEVPAGSVIGREFLGGRVAIFRGHNGIAKVMSAYCPHIGADLAVGKVVDNRLRCAFHHWEFDQNGMCAKTGIGDPPPRQACLFDFPTRERFGIVWAFNGTEALWDQYDFDVADENIAFDAFYTDDYACDPWVFASNTPDIQHIEVVHGIRFMQDPHQLTDWDEWGFRMCIDGRHQDDEKLQWNVGIRGTSTFIQEGTVDGWWLGVAAGFSMPCPGKHQVFLAICVRDVAEDAGKSVKERIEFGKMLLARTAAEDKPILDSIHHQVGYLTHGDRTLNRYFKLLRDFPRAHPSADFIV